jgi:hypothetical protein
MEKNEYLEPEEIEVEQVGGEYDPMGTPINERPYTKPNVKINPKDLQGDIPEPSFQPPLIDLDKPKFDDIPLARKKETEPLNREMNDLPKKDKKIAASHVANMIMQVYEGLNTLASAGMVFNDKKLNRLQQEGIVDFSIKIKKDYTSNQTITAAEFIQDFNSQHANSLKVTNEFKEEVTPILERVLIKRGVGMTDEQMLIFLFGQDIAIKGGQFLQARTQMNQIIDMLKEQTLEMKSGDFRSQVNTPPPPPSPQPETKYEYNQATILETGEEFEDGEDEQEDFFEDGVDDSEIVGSVQEQVEAQLQRKTVAQIRKEQIAQAKQSYKGKTITSGKRGRKKNNKNG